MNPNPAATGLRATATGQARYLLRVSVQKSEVDLAAQFLAKGGTLGGAAAQRMAGQLAARSAGGQQPAGGGAGVQRAAGQRACDQLVGLFGPMN